MAHELQQAKQKLRAYALSTLGFDLFGVAPAQPLEGQRHLAAWLALGFHGEMAYMERSASLRGDPRALLPEASSVICVACTYHDPPDPPPPPGHARVARYARRRDYHKVMRKKLLQLGRYMREAFPQAQFKVVVDSGPLLEKELAQRAGLGWIGKNTCLINRHLGSELLLGELITTLPLPPDQPETDHCGTCTACLAACPTEALRQPYQLDARRCISYLTIEHKSPFGETPPHLAGYLFGCDLCQTCCPWNRHAPERVNPHLATRTHLANLSIAKLAALDADGWAQLAEGTPLRRLSFQRLHRNLTALLTGPAERSTNRIPGETPGR